jgi:hypothetical protein
MSIRVLPHASAKGRRRIRDDARDGLTAAAVSLGGSIALTLALAALLRWLG